jgi:CubicO group peptidase (beta-lactamase class C family)
MPPDMPDVSGDAFIDLARKLLTATSVAIGSPAICCNIPYAHLRPNSPAMASASPPALGTRIAAPTTPGELLLGTPGYTFGLSFAVRQGAGVAGVRGSAGEFMWAGYAGTYFWVDPKEELVAVYMSQAPSTVRAYYRRLVKQLVYAQLSTE